MSETTPLVVGIDLGTTHTVVARAECEAHAEPSIFEVPQLVGRGESRAQPLLPSFLYAPLPGEIAEALHDDGPWVAGQFAFLRGREVPGRLIASAKSWLCHAAVDRTAAILPWGSEAADVPRLSPIEASARVLAHVRRAWDAQFPEHPLDRQTIVLTVPASFDQAARELTLRAAHQAGLAVRLLEEPQAAFYAALAADGAAGLQRLAQERGGRARVLVCDVGGGTTDLSLIEVDVPSAGALELRRVAVGRHLLLGGDNMDLALAHACEARLQEDAKLDTSRFAQLALECRSAKERLLGADAPDRVGVTLLGQGSNLFASTLRTELTHADVEAIVLDGFFPPAEREAQPERRAAGLVAFGLPYERDPRITRHLASFFAKHAPDAKGPDAILFNGGLFLSERVRERVRDVVASWGGPEPVIVPQPDPDLAVALGAARFGLAIAGHGLVIGGGAAHGYYVGIDTGSDERCGVCVVPRGSKEGERHVIRSRPLELVVGRPVRFELYASDSGPAHAPGQIVDIDDGFELLPPVATHFESGEGSGEHVPVALEGELSAAGTLELGCVEASPREAIPRRFRLAFELRGAEPGMAATERARSQRPRSDAPLGKRFEEAVEAVQRVFGKGRSDVKARETKDLLRELERILGARGTWTTDVTRALFDVVGPKHKARRRSTDHERVYWMLAGYCLRPGFGNALDPGRIAVLRPLFPELVVFGSEPRNWQQFFIALRRVAGGLDEATQIAIRDTLDPFVAPADAKLAKPKGLKIPPCFELLELLSWLERVPPTRKAELGRWVLERTWTDRDPRLWAILGRLGARVPAYSSAHHVVAPRTVESWLDHLLRERWNEIPTAPRTATLLARVSSDRTRDLGEGVRGQIARALERSGAPTAWVRQVMEFVPVEETERAELFGEELPVGLRLVEPALPAPENAR